MNTLQPLPTPRTSLTTDRETTSNKLANQIIEAVDITTAGIKNQDEAYAHCFLPKNDLARILSRGPLHRLFRELIIDTKNTFTAEGTVHNAEPDYVIEGYVERIVGDPSKVALLALFLYEQHDELLRFLMDWLVFNRADFPSDDEMPFTKNLVAKVFLPKHHRYILRNQAIFKPVVIRRNQHQVFKSWSRLPYIGAQTPIKDGSSGTVFKTTIAPGHWEIMSLGSYIPGNPDNPVVVALKTFRNVSGRRGTETTDDFENEREILDDLRKCKTKHAAIMLDWGSITVQDEADNPISHSLIFELATSSLADFLKDQRCARVYTTKSVLFSRLVDVIEALACLHNTLKTLHLDIKPDNILIFERGSENENEDGNPLVWKLSDFGLARKKNARQRTGLRGFEPSYHASHSSTLPATRHAGAYQAPEIQERDSSQAGRRSDVWSMGCVTLMVLAFATGADTEVSTLESRLSVDFMNRGGKQNLFYVRSDSHQWKVQTSYLYDYMEDFHSVVGLIPGTERPLQAAVHPLVIEWSNVLHESYPNPNERMIVREALDVVFRHVLLIDRIRRITASEFRRRLASIQQRWESYENGTELPIHLQPIPFAGRTIGTVHVTEDAVPRPLEPVTTLESSIAEEEEEGKQPNGLAYPLVEDPLSSLSHPALCSAIRYDNINIVRSELERDTSRLSNPCSSCNVYPLHQAVKNKAYKVLEVILNNPDCSLSVTGKPCPESGYQTVVELASEGGGDSKALRCFLKHCDKFSVDNGLYRECKGRLGHESRKALEKLCKQSDSQSQGRGVFGRLVRR